MLFSVDILFTIFFFNLPWHADKHYSRHSFGVCILYSLCSMQTFLFILPRVLSSAEQLTIQNNLINNILKASQSRREYCAAHESMQWKCCEISAGHVALWFIFRKMLHYVHSQLALVLIVCAQLTETICCLYCTCMRWHTHTHTPIQWANTVCDCARQLSVTLWP